MTPTLNQPCGCSDCQSAISPPAYLADLIDYTLKHVRKEIINKIDLPFLEDVFHQPFSDLPSDCESADKQLRQVRICIEVLRRYLGNRPLADLAKQEKLIKAEADYCFAVYSIMLSRIGTSYEEIRRMRSETDENRKAFAERLGIDLTQPRPADIPGDINHNGDELDQLFMDTSGKLNDHLLSEESIERLFGLPDTTRNPLSEGTKLDDKQNQVTYWNLNNVLWDQNTDQNGLVYMSLLSPSATIFRVELYKDILRSNSTLVASGEINIPAGKVKINAENDSRLSGTIDIAYTAGSVAISISVVPLFLSWQLNHLRKLWVKQDNPSDAYQEGLSIAELGTFPAGLIFPAPINDKLNYDTGSKTIIFEGMMPEAVRDQLLTLSADPEFQEAIADLFIKSQVPPIIDPDIIGPDDFRSPVIKEAGPDRAFDIWIRRREKVDNILRDLQADREDVTKGFSFILNKVFGASSPELDTLLKDLTRGANLQKTKRKIRALHLTIESLMRLLEIRSKDPLIVTRMEWMEVYSILAQAEKMKIFPGWLAEEQGASIQLNLQEFMFSLNEPKQGDWPVTDQPLIDPGIVKLNDLPEWLAGKGAVIFWNTRKNELEQIPVTLKNMHEADANTGFEDMLELVFGTPPTDETWGHQLDNLKNNLGSSETNRNNATEQIENVMHLTIDTFKRLMVLKGKNDEAQPEKKPTVAEWAEMYMILTPSYKSTRLNPVWIEKENTPKFPYWKARKANLPLWRANLEARQNWVQALHTRNQQPVIDPDMIGANDLQHLLPGDPAFDIWKARHAIVNNYRDELKISIPLSDADAINYLDKIIKDALVFTASDLEALDEERKTGHNIEKRLDQIPLTYGAFTYLMKIRALAKTEQHITDFEWDTICATLTRSWINRQFAFYRTEEMENVIVLSPDFFMIPSEILTPLPFLGPSTPPWLSTWQMRRDWQDKLQSRMDQENSVYERSQNAIGSVEETTLPLLRDGLIRASDAAGDNLDEQGEWITKRLLLDAKTSGCQVTTRVELAIETCQTLLFTLRSGLFRQLPGFSLSLIADHFEEEWKWIGSYRTWRPPKFVTLYPENILQPSLLKYKTPAFQTLINNTRTIELNPQTACDEANKYGNYYRDICTLEIQATCQASTVVHTGEGCNRQSYIARSMFYMFGLAPGGKVYWSAYNPGNSSDYSQRFWEEIEIFSTTKVVRIIGAMPYRNKISGMNAGSGVLPKNEVISAYVYLFCVCSDAGKQTLKLAKLNLEDFGIWHKDVKTITSPLEQSVKLNSIVIVPIQTTSDVISPGLIFDTPGAGLYLRLLNNEGEDWERADLVWSSFRISHSGKYKRIVAVLSSNSDEFWFIENSAIADGALEINLVNVSFGGVKRRDIFFDTEFLGAIPGPQTNDCAVHVFWRDSSGSHYKHYTYDGLNHPVNEALSDLIQIPSYSGHCLSSQKILAYQRSKNAGSFYIYNYAESGDSLLGSSTLRAVPRAQSSVKIPLRLSSTQLRDRRLETKQNFMLNEEGTSSIQHYLNEACYYVPMHLALGLQSAGFYLESLDCLRTIYDYQAQIIPVNQRNIYYGLELDAKLPYVPFFQQANDWLLDPLNPHLIAATRRYALTRFFLMSLVRCLFDYADAEFTQYTGESIATARSLYTTGLDILKLPELRQTLNPCDDVIEQMKIEPGKDVPPEAPALMKKIMDDLTNEPSFRLATNWKDLLDIFELPMSVDSRIGQIRERADAFFSSGLLPETIGSLSASRKSILMERHNTLLIDAGIDNQLQNASKAIANKTLADSSSPINQKIGVFLNL